ncbi:MAG: peptidoglycan DD-metalloendopeptidase family protein, partial [Clostridia bacterium]|nr:peptidoglycan DD-metalloendopeptidase family protein [Clostridia bacterium]
GIEVSRTILSETTLSEPIEKVVKVGTKTPPRTMATGSFVRPCSGYLTSRFGYRWGRSHNGIDIGASTGTPIYAADGGVITMSGWNGGYGKMIVINHENGYVTYYAHCSRLLYSSGKRVAKGDVIAYVGNTGNSTGPHLHFEVRLNGSPRNPLNYVSY